MTHLKIHEHQPRPDAPDSDPQDPLRWMTPEEVAAKLVCTPAHVRLMCRQGLLPAQKFGKIWRIHYQRFRTEICEVA